MNNDKCTIALALNETVRVYLLNNKDTINTAIQKHHLWPSSASVLGKTLSIAQIMGCMLKGDEALTIKIQGNGYCGKVIVDANALGEVRGYVEKTNVNFVNNNGGLNDYYALGNEGIIEVIKDLKLKDIFTTSTTLTGNLSSDFTYYFYESEQTPSIVSLGILIDTDNFCNISGGIVIQVLPNATEGEIKYLENSANKLNNYSSLLKEKTSEEILQMMFGNNYKVLEEKQVSFKCNCSKESFSRSLLTLGSKTLQEIYDDDKKIDAVCHYCNENYHFNDIEIANLINECKAQGK